MPSLALVAAAFMVGVEQLVQWKYGVTGVLGLTLLTIGIKMRGDQHPLDALPARATSFAGWAVGRRRHPDMGAEWASVLAGVSSSGARRRRAIQMFYALGFITAALRIRLTDLFGAVWRPIDWVLSRKSRTDAVFVVALLIYANAIRLHSGWYGLATEGLTLIPAGALLLRSLLNALRRARGIELARADQAPQPDEEQRSTHDT